MSLRQILEQVMVNPTALDLMNVPAAVLADAVKLKHLHITALENDRDRWQSHANDLERRVSRLNEELAIRLADMEKLAAERDKLRTALEWYTSPPAMNAPQNELNRLREEKASLVLDRNLLAAENALKKSAIDELAEIVDGMERGVISLAAENVKLAAERDALRAQLAESWEPVGNDEMIELEDLPTESIRIVEGHIVASVFVGEEDDTIECHVWLPDWLRLCRRTTS